MGYDELRARAEARSGVEPVRRMARQPPDAILVARLQDRQDLERNSTTGRERLQAALRQSERIRACCELGLVLTLALDHATFGTRSR